ncbi:MAG TPA: DUF2934 domain-containing protein [Vicinamibacterales bacterium]|nr:DUF2934 domain-containing protein [Vicinamibacterales bacterium]
MDINTDSPAFIILPVADIAERAYQLYIQRGRVHGFDREDWLRAEHELKQLGNTGATTRSSPQTERSRSIPA